MIAARREKYRAPTVTLRHLEREEFYRSVLESLGEGILITDRESRILYANSRVESLTGYSRVELLGAVSHELLTPREEWPAMRRRLKERLTGKEDEYELEHIRKDGGRHWVSVRALPYRTGRGDIVGTIGLLSCIKKRKTLEFENEYLQEEFRANYRAILGDSPALKLGANAPRLTPAQIKELQSYDWPGNVRELQNLIERAVIRARNGHLDLGLRPSGILPVRAPGKADSIPRSAPVSLQELKRQERAFILDALARTRGKIYGPDGAAALLGLKPTTLSSKVHRLGLKKIGE